MTSALIAALALTAAPPVAKGEVFAPSATRTVIKDQTAAKRLRGNTGVTVQWIGWDKRGKLRVTPGKHWRLTGGQVGATGHLDIDGFVAEIGRDTIVFEGRITIADTPDLNRHCERLGRYSFKATGQRRYWRLEQMEACDGLTDYVDIYF